MSDDQKPETYGKALLQIAGMVGGFALALGLGHHAFVESLKAPPPAAAPAAAPAPSVSGGGFTLTSASIALPEDDPRSYVYRVYEWIAYLTENLLGLH